MDKVVEEAETIRKLRFLPREELSKIVTKLYSFDDNKLIESVKKISGKKIRKPDSYIHKCNAENLIELISAYGNLPEDAINAINLLYDEYIYGVNPSIYFSQLVLDNWKSFEEIESELPAFIMENSHTLSEENEDKYKNFEIFNIFLERKVIEILFKFHKRIDYIDPETAKPAFVYTLEEGIIWLVKDLNALITKCSEYPVTSFINKLFREYLNCRIKRFTLHKNIVNSVLGKETIRTGNYVKPNPAPNDIKHKTCGDENLMEKPEGRDTDEKYDRTSSFHKITGITNSQTGINVNSTLGKISLRAHLKKTDLREWSLKIIKQVIGEMTILKTSDIVTFSKAINLEDISALQSVNNQIKEIILNIIIAIHTVKSKGIQNISTNYSAEDLYSKAGAYFNFVFVLTCSSCGSILYKCRETDDFGSVSFSGRFLTATCDTCGENIISISEHFECVCGNEFEGDFNERIIALPTQELISLINNTIKEIDFPYKLEPNEILKFSNGDFNIIPTDYKYLYSFDELPDFKYIPPLSKIDQQVAKDQVLNIEKHLKEKCENYSDYNCRNCLIERKGHCLQRIIAFFTDSEIHAHSPVEFGDFSFRQKIDGSSYNIICLAKSYTGAPGTKKNDHKYTMKNNGGLLNQVVETIFDTRINFIGIVSGADLDSRLKDAIISLTKLQSKKIVFFEKKELIRVLSQYCKKE